MGHQDHCQGDALQTPQSLPVKEGGGSGSRTVSGGVLEKKNVGKVWGIESHKVGLPVQTTAWGEKEGEG